MLGHTISSWLIWGSPPRCMSWMTMGSDRPGKQTCTTALLTALRNFGLARRIFKFWCAWSLSQTYGQQLPLCLKQMLGRGYLGVPTSKVSLELAVPSPISCRSSHPQGHRHYKKSTPCSGGLSSFGAFIRHQHAGQLLGSSFCNSTHSLGGKPCLHLSSIPGFTDYGITWFHHGIKTGWGKSVDNFMHQTDGMRLSDYLILIVGICRYITLFSHDLPLLLSSKTNIMRLPTTYGPQLVNDICVILSTLVWTKLWHQLVKFFVGARSLLILCTSLLT